MGKSVVTRALQARPWRDRGIERGGDQSLSAGSTIHGWAFDFNPPLRFLASHMRAALAAAIILAATVVVLLGR